MPRVGHKPKLSAPPSLPSGVGVPTGAVFTVDDLAVYLKLPKRTIYKLVQEGKIPGQKVGRHWRFHRQTIDKWLSRGGSSPTGARK
ncbi:MAG: helix-turn-helix domain-containing protein [Phycisphaerae bacterium]|nr:helix-turn-helix domain-containing protein [Phycisphaerae bacterium]